MIWIRSAALGLAALLAVTTLSRGEELAEEPYRLVRELTRLQDQVAAGRRKAYPAQHDLTAALSAKLAAAAPKSWGDARNRRAAVLFVLSGGAPAILRTLLSQGRFPDAETELAAGVLAYAEGRSLEARAHLAGIDARSLDPSLAGAVALVQSSLAAESDHPARVLGLLDQARLLSPGTLVEESALRRQIFLLLEAKEPERANSLLRRYIRRFARSDYAIAFWDQFAAKLAEQPTSENSKHLAELESFLKKADAEVQGWIYLSLARQGIARGNRFLVQFAAPRAALWQPNAVRASLYEAAALVLTDDYDRAVSMLMNMNARQFTNEDAGLREAALSVARQIRRLPSDDGQASTPIGEAESPARELSQIGRGTIERAAAMIADVDALLNEGPQ